MAVALTIGLPSWLTAIGPFGYLDQDSVIGGVAIRGEVESHDHFGSAVAFGDFNNDGFDDLAVGAPNDDVNGVSDAGVVNVVYGSENGLTGTANQTFGLVEAGLPLGSGDLLGSALATGDFNNDGNADLAIGIPQRNQGTNDDRGAVMVVYGSETGLAKTNIKTWTPNELAGASTFGERFGTALAAGDFDGDGIDDLAVGAPRTKSADTLVANILGSVRVIFGTQSTGLRPADNQFFRPANTTANYSMEFGSALAAGDFNGDGVDDLGVGAPGFQGCSNPCANSGKVLILRGFSRRLGPGGLENAGGGAVDAAPVSGWTLANLPLNLSPAEYDGFGTALAAGDVDFDGYADLAIGIPQRDAGTVTSAGMVAMVYGAANILSVGSPGRVAAWNQASPDIDSNPYPNEEFGRTLVIGNFNGDSYLDLAVGTPYDQSAGAAVGSVSILFSDATGVTTNDLHLFQGTSTDAVPGLAEDGDEFGWALAAGDWYGRGVDGLAVGVPLEDIGSYPNAGAVNTLYGLVDTPGALSQQVTVQEEVEFTITLRGVDPQGQNLDFLIKDLPSRGSLRPGQPSPIFNKTSTTAQTTYKSFKDQYGPDSFTFIVVDSQGNESDPGRVSVNIENLNDAPTLTLQASATTKEGSPVKITASIADPDPPQTLSLRVQTAPQHGTVSTTLALCNPANLFSGQCVTYTPTPYFYGEDTFTLDAWDGKAASVEKTTTVTVTPVNDPPFATDVSAATDEDIAVRVYLSGGDVDDDPTFATLAAGHGSLGVVTPAWCGAKCWYVLYTPDAEWFGTDTFNFTVTGRKDSSTGVVTATATAKATVTVKSVNDLPKVVGRSDTTGALPEVDAVEDIEKRIDVAFSDVETWLSALTVNLRAYPKIGNVSFFRTPTGATFSYRSLLNRNGDDSFQFAVDDNQGGVTLVTVPIKVAAENDVPTLNLIPDRTVQATSAQGAVVAFGATGTDVEDGSIQATCEPASGTTFALGATSVTCTVTDAGGATAARTFTVKVVDTTKPSLTAPASFSVGATGPGGAVVDYELPVAQDAIDGAITAVCTPAPGSTFAIGTTTVTCTATDKSGNTVSAAFTVSVTNNAPSFTAPATISAEATGAAGATVSFTAQGQDVEDGALDAVCAPASGTNFPLGTTNVSCTVTDKVGAQATGDFAVSVVDTTAPGIAAPANLEVSATSADGAVVTFIAPATTDAVDGPGVAVCSPVSGSTFAIGGTEVTCSAQDAAGNTASATFTVSVTNNAPTITAPAAITAEATGAAGALVSFDVQGQDVEDGAIEVVCVPASGTNFPLGTTTVSCTVTDKVGAQATGDFTVSVVDTTAPGIATKANLAVSATSANGAVVTFIAPATTDAVDGPGVATCSPASGSTFAIGDSEVTCSTQDAAGNTASATFTVSVTNNAPSFTAPAAVSTEATGAAGATVSFTAQGQDVEDGTIDAVCLPASGTSFSLGSTTVSCTVTDVAGATATGSFAVTVVDTTAPVVTFTGQQATYDVSATVTIDCAATDAVGVVSSTCAPVSAPATSFVVGENTLTATATDAAGNTGTATVTFTVVVTNGGLQDVVTDLLGADAAPLTASLQAAASARTSTAAAGQINSFKNKVQAQRGKKLTAAEADLLLALADQIR